MTDFSKTICVIGLGYIGLPTASLLGTKGYQVHGVDMSQHVVDTINQGKIHIVEPDLDILVKSAVQAGNLTASLEPTKADVFILAVPTPYKVGHEPDLSYVEAATKMIAPYVEPGNLVILESTSPVGTTDEIVTQILRKRDMTQKRMSLLLIVLSVFYQGVFWLNWFRTIASSVESTTYLPNRRLNSTKHLSVARF